MARTKTATTLVISDNRPITHRPTKNFKVDWGTNALDSMKKYLTTDARTEEGREYIAEHNNVFEAWKAKNDAFPKGT